MHLLGENIIGNETLIADDVIIGHPAKTALLKTRDFTKSGGASIGNCCILRSGTVIYEGVQVGNDVQFAHHVVIREGAIIGDGCVFGNATVIREGAVLGRNVRLMECVIVSEAAQIGNDVFVGPNVSFTGGRFMTGSMEASKRMSHQEAITLEGRYWQGPSVIIEDDVRIGSGSVILAGVRLGKASVIAAGSVVSMNVPPGATVAGNPCRIISRGKSDMEARISTTQELQ